MIASTDFSPSLRAFRQLSFGREMQIYEVDRPDCLAQHDSTKKPYEANAASYGFFDSLVWRALLLDAERSKLLTRDIRYICVRAVL